MTRTRTITLVAVALATVAVIGTATAGLGGRSGAESAPRRTGPAATAEVTRTTLTDTLTVAGTLGYGEPIPLRGTATGTVTWLAPTGSTVRRGEPLLRVDEQPVLLLYGTVPMYRSLTEGMTGSDVQQLERNLAALRYGGLTVDDTFTSATTAIVKRWQKDLRLPQTGAVERDRVLYAPDAVRVAAHLTRIGASATGDLLGYTGGTKLVTVQASAGGAPWAAKGTNVTVALPGGATVAGVVASIGDTASGADGGPGDEPAQQASPGTATATVPVTITVADQPALARFEKTPVDVRYVAAERVDVLTVPVSALLGLAEGGYGVEVVDGGTVRVVAVRVGLVAGGRVEINGAGIEAGTTVGVPE